MTTAPARRAAVSARISADVKDWLSRILRAETSARGRIPCARARAWHLFLHDMAPDRSLIYVQAIGPSDNPLWDITCRHRALAKQQGGCSSRLTKDRSAASDSDRYYRTQALLAATPDGDRKKQNLLHRTGRPREL